MAKIRVANMTTPAPMIFNYLRPPSNKIKKYVHIYILAVLKHSTHAGMIKKA